MTKKRPTLDGHAPDAPAETFDARFPPAPVVALTSPLNGARTTVSAIRWTRVSPRPPRAPFLARSRQFGARSVASPTRG